MDKFCIIGTGAWATAFGLSLASLNKSVFLYGINPKEISDISSGYNKKYFGDNKFKNSLSATNDLKQATSSTNCIILAIPSKALDEFLDELKTVLSPLQNYVIINLIKGLDFNNLDVLSKMIEARLKGIKVKVVSVSGPSFASEVFFNKHTVLNVAAKSYKLAVNISKQLQSKYLKFVPIKDYKGLQVCSSLKNYLAIACGMGAYLSDSINTNAALISSGIEEIRQICKVLKSNGQALLSYGGIGDIVLTCSSNKSRNYQFGYELAKANNLNIIERNKFTTVEGIEVSYFIRNLTSKYMLDIPLFSTLTDLLDHKFEPVQFLDKYFSALG